MGEHILVIEGKWHHDMAAAHYETLKAFSEHVAKNAIGYEPRADRIDYRRIMDNVVIVYEAKRAGEHGRAAPKEIQIIEWQSREPR